MAKRELWHIVEERIDGSTYGDCDHARRVIRIDPRLNRANEQRLDTLIHELLHAAVPWLPEKIVRFIASFLSQALHDQGYRRRK